MPVEAPPVAIIRAVDRVFPGLLRDAVSDIRGALALFPGTQVSSWYRTPQRNREVGGAGASQHLIGFAFDLVPPRPVWSSVATWLRQARWTVIDEGDHLHAQVFKADARAIAFVRWAARFA